MQPGTLKRLKIGRIISQILFFALFLYIYIRSLDPFAILENPFLRFDPLIFLTNPEANLPVLAVLAALLILAIVLGRVFCGWICPLGSLIEALDFILSPLRKRNPVALQRYPKRKLLVRYPVSLLLLGAVLVTVFTPVPVLQFLHPNVWIIRIVSLTTVGLVFFALMVVLSLFARRLWCTYLCPLGALYGLLARIPMFRLRISACNSCGRCDRCPTEAANFQDREIMAHQCLVCFDYEAACPTRGFRFTLPRADSQTIARRTSSAIASAVSPSASRGRQPGRSLRPTDPASRSRRSFLKQGVQLVVGLAVGGVLTGIFRRRITELLRPPGVVDEALFVENCLRCLQCVRSCPNQIIKITSGEYGFASLYTPHLEFRPYGCDYFCQVCQQVCPNRAIPLQTLAEKQSTPIGEARIDETTCVVYKEKFNCLVCEEVCPVPEKAIRYDVTEELGDDGEPLREPKMIPERCIGCGICEAKCPAEPVAIRVFAT
ncbi:MAG: 4Fe-4S binding protein [Spirochaetaceae bacterium]|nr:MAG: 4Fe-4S binding protein [Spirochaetaceae bacterium]